jgi:hypothetical protein
VFGNFDEEIEPSESWVTLHCGMLSIRFWLTATCRPLLQSSCHTHTRTPIVSIFILMKYFLPLFLNKYNRILLFPKLSLSGQMKILLQRLCFSATTVNFSFLIMNYSAENFCLVSAIVDRRKFQVSWQSISQINFPGLVDTIMLCRH